MGGNSPGIDGNLHTVRVETARYGFCIRIQKLVTGIWKGRVRVGRSCCGSKWVNTGLTQFHKLFFYVCRCGLTRVGAGESGIRCRSTRVEMGQNSLIWGLHSGNAVTHSWISNQVHTEFKPYRPGSTHIDPHRNPCQYLMDSGSTIWRRKKFWSCSKFLHGFQFRIDIRIDPVLTALTRINLQCTTALILVIYCIVLYAVGWDKVLHPGR
jgi:hypothetical protein